MNQNSYDEICAEVNKIWKNLSNPTVDDLKSIGKKLNIDVKKDDYLKWKNLEN